MPRGPALLAGLCSPELSSSSSLTLRCHTLPPQKRGARMENERNGEVPHQSLCWKDSFGEHHTQREKPGMQGAGKLCLLLLLHPPAPARARVGVGERQRVLPESILILLLESKRPAAAEDRTSSTAWKELTCSETQALDAKLRCLTPRQGRAWAPWVTGMSVWTER